MKKIFSLLIAATIMMSAFAGVASAAQITSANKATLTIAVEEEATPSSAAETYATESLYLDPDTYKVYKINIIAGNLPELTKASNTSYTGEGITSVAAAIGVTSSSPLEYEVDFGFIPKKGAATWNDSKSTYDWYAGNETSLMNNVGVKAGDSQTLTYLEVVVSNEKEVSFTFSAGALGAAVYSANRPNQGTGFYNITAEIGNLQVVAYPAEEEPGIDPVEEVAAKAQGAALTDLNGDAVTLDADYGIAKFDTAINTGLYNYFIVAKTATATSDPMAVDFSGALEVGGKVSFYALVKSTHGAITSLKLQEVAK